MERPVAAAGPGSRARTRTPRPESWLALDDDELLHRIETFGAERTRTTGSSRSSTSHRHFFVRQEAAKRVKDRARLFAFEDDRHVGQILVRHLTRARTSPTSSGSRREPPRRGALRRPRSSSRASGAGSRRPSRGGERASRRPAWPAHAPAAAPTVALPAPADPTSAGSPADRAGRRRQVDGSLLGWAAHFVVEQAVAHLGTAATRELLLATQASLPGPTRPSRCFVEVRRTPA